MKRSLITIIVAIVIVASLVIAGVIWFGCKRASALEEKDAKAAVVPVLVEYPITPKAKFATRCPYCNHLCISKSCQLSFSGSSTPGDENNTEVWSITYACSACGMGFVGTRSQSVPQVSSFRLRTSE